MGRISLNKQPRPVRSALAVHIGNQMLELRQSAQLTLRAVSKETGLASSTISSIENGVNTPAADTLWLLAKLYDVDVNRFYRGYTE